MNERIEQSGAQVMQKAHNVIRYVMNDFFLPEKHFTLTSRHVTSKRGNASVRTGVLSPYGILIIAGVLTQVSHISCEQ